MKTLRRLCAVFALTLMLALSAFAGEMTTMISAPSPSTSTATEIALNLLQSVLSLF